MMRGQIRSDERGAIMLIAVFMAVFVVALLYYLIGISQTLMFREKFQDAADSAALSGAVIHARGMNLIVLINIVMAALLSVLVTVKLIETLAIIGLAIAAAAAWFTGGGSLVAVEPLTALRNNMHDIYDTLKGPIFDGLKVLHNTADAVKNATPAAADLLVLADIEATEDPVGIHGVVFSTRIPLTLPVEDDSFSELCGRAGEVPGELAKDILEPIPGVSLFMGELSSAMGELSRKLSAWFCGDGSGSPPSQDVEIKRSYPRTELNVACEQESKNTGHTMTDVCARLQADEEAAAPDEATGQCQAGRDCGINGPYEKHVALAREQCDPTKSPKPFVYFYQLRSGHVDYVWTGRDWIRQKPVYEAIWREKSEHGPPCGPEALFPFFAPGYNKTVRESDDVDEVLPVCTKERPPGMFESAESVGDIRTVSFTEVSHILGCQKKEKMHFDLSDAPRAGESGEDKAPKRVESDAQLGDENFQIRAVLHGSVPGGLPERMMRLALWDQAAPDNPMSTLRVLGDFSVAQAEYFFDDDVDRGDWMWTMNWRARLRRFRVPLGTADALGRAWSELGSTPAALLQEADRLNQVVAH